MFFCTRSLQFRQLLKKLRQQAEEVCSTSKFDRKVTIFSEKFRQKRSCEHVEWMHFGKPDQKSSTESQKTHAYFPKKTRKIKFGQTIFFPKVFKWSRKTQFRQRRWKKFARRSKLIRSMSDNENKVKLFSEWFQWKLFLFSVRKQIWENRRKFVGRRMGFFQSR